MVYQQFINYPSLSVYENIASPLRVSRVPRSEIETRVREAAKLLKLEPYLDRKPLNLSGGQQQRTAIARALVKRADLVLLDEPLANLDYKLREELREELPRVFAASGAIFVYATTEPTEALLLGGNTATLFQGRVTQFGADAAGLSPPHTISPRRGFSRIRRSIRLTARTKRRQRDLEHRRADPRYRRPRRGPRRGLHRRLPRPSPHARTGRRRRDRHPGHRLRRRDHRVGELSSTSMPATTASWRSCRA